MRPRRHGTTLQSRARARWTGRRWRKRPAVRGALSRRCLSSTIICLATDRFLFAAGLFSLFNSPDSILALVGLVTPERDGAPGVGLDDVAVLGGDGVDAEVQASQVDGIVGDDLHEGELTEVQGFLGGDLEPVAAGEELGGGFDDVLLALAGAEKADAEAGDDACAGADVGANDDVSALVRAAGGVVLGVAGGSVCVDDEGPAGGFANDLVADAQIEDRVLDVELDGRGLAFEGDDGVGGR